MNLFLNDIGKVRMSDKLKKLSLFSLFCLLGFLYAQNSDSPAVAFVKGNLADKTAAVTKAAGREAEELSLKAINFSLENKGLLGTDRELESLTVAAIYSLPPENIKNWTKNQKDSLITKFEKVFTDFSDSDTVQIALLTKITSLKDSLDTSTFTRLLNDYLKMTNSKDIRPGLFKALLTSLEKIGNNESFIILYTLLTNSVFEPYKTDIENTAVVLVPSAVNEILTLIQNSQLDEIARLFNISQKNTEISKNVSCQIAENVLSRSILYMDKSSGLTNDQVDLELRALKILSDNKWTRASETGIAFFSSAKKVYENGKMDDKKFSEIICSLSSVAPIDSVLPLSQYLEELNGHTEKGNIISTSVILSVIKTLGAIGDKAAFDSLLAVTYLSYPESVLKAARDALSGLRWQ